ncbi:galactose metabolism- protein [Gnomoniopsis sp. IMI 355080]|nr:galactose metabolism- protein [Gnomoniopsis sp. IMI 355080]
MGNQPSTTKEGGGHQGRDSSSPREQPSSGSASASHSRSTSTRAPISVRNHRAAAPAQASLAQAHGSTDIKNSQALPITSLAASPVGSTKSASGGVAAPRPLEPRQSVPVPVRTESDNAVAEAAPSKPVDVPNQNALNAAAGAAAVEPPVGQTPPLSPFDSSEAGLASHGSLSNMSFISRPPRLPLPIEEEVHTPGSPIIAPADIGEPLDAADLDGETLPRKTSNLSNTTIDEDDAEELRVDKTRPTVPTRLEWLRGGERVYVTGTIFQWNRKQRLHPVEGRPGVFATTIQILPGTHHIRFLVDNDMQTSPDLPTTVDFGNNLVNYIEVSSDDVPTPGDVTVTPTPQATPSEEKEQQVQGADEAEQQQRSHKQLPPPEAFTRTYPQYLADYEADDTPEGQAAAQMAVLAIEKLDTPPSLPGFLAKPILNAATLMKDDNSVLNMPNHTTLNHLATSSIKNGTLAVSATTRYRDKYVTTIMYKPVPG